MRLALQTGVICLLYSILLSQEVDLIEKELSDKAVSVIFDGTTRLGEALAILLCFVDTYSNVWCVYGSTFE